MDARIGKLIREGKEIFYAFIGAARKYFEGTLRAVEIKLGVRVECKPRKYSVTVTPKHAAWFAAPHTVEVVARDRNEAIKRARSEYSDNASYHGDTATYRAKLA